MAMPRLCIAVFTSSSLLRYARYIQPGEAYIRRQFIAEGNMLHMYDVYVSNGKGGVTHGQYKTITATGDRSYKPWEASQAPFTLWNSTGSALVASPSVIINGIGNYHVFTLTHAAQYLYPQQGKNSNAGEPSRKNLPAGFQVALLHDDPYGTVMGRKYIMYVKCHYWRYPGTNQWFRFIDNDGNEQDHVFIDFGFQYGLMPSTRLLR